MHDRAAARLQAARYQQELSALKQSAHGLTFRTDSQGTICAVNAHWHTLASQSAKSAIGQRLWDLVLPDCRPAVANLFTTGKPGDLQTTQARLAHPDGTVRVLDISVMPLHDDSGRLHGFAGCASDCTELLATRQQLQDQQAFSSLSFESIPVPICETGLDGRLVSVNHAWERFMGLRREQVLGLRHDEFLPQDQARVYDAQDQSFGTRTCYEAALRQADGKPHTVQVTKVRRLSHLGQPLGMLIVSVQTKAHAMAVQATARSTHGHSEFAARLSQELLRPLQSILGFSELGMAHARSQAALAAMFQEIRAAGESIHQQLHEWLDITEAERCIDTYLFARHDLRRLIGVVAAELQPQLQRKQLTLELQLGTEPLVATVDSQHFTRVMGHVLASAAQFSPQGQSIHVAAHAPDDATIHISIRDQGPGRGQGADISGPEIQAILQAVAPGDCTIATSASENLGLSTCQKIVTAHGGRIYTTNTPQGGAAVHIHLPIDAGR